MDYVNVYLFNVPSIDGKQLRFSISGIVQFSLKTNLSM